MLRIIPIKDLKNTAKISELCHTSDEPVFVTKNGYGDMVIMSMETYESRLFMQEVYRKVIEAEQQISTGNIRESSLPGRCGVSPQKG